jgi:hypothetical protein
MSFSSWSDVPTPAAWPVYHPAAVAGARRMAAGPGLVASGIGRGSQGSGQNLFGKPATTLGSSPRAGFFGIMLY